MFAATRPPMCSIVSRGTARVSRAHCNPVLRSSLLSSVPSSIFVARHVSQSHVAPTQEAYLAFNSTCTIIAHRPQETVLYLSLYNGRSRLIKGQTSDDIVAELTSLASPESSRRSSLLVLLLTPSLSRLLDTDDFSRKAVHKIFENVSSSDPDVASSFDVVTAVVDRLPARRPQSSRERVDAEGGKLHLSRVLWPPVGDHGYEGVACLVASRNAAMPDLWGAVSFAEKIGLRPRDDPGTLSISITPSSVTSNTTRRVPLFELPLANTVFQTGRRTTMMVARWARSGQSALQKVKQADVQNLTLRLDLTSPELTIPLLPLTNPSIIDQIMGNVVRRLRNHDEGPPVPASGEIERNISKYFETTGKPQNTVSVWALLIPEKTWRNRVTLNETKEAKGAGLQAEEGMTPEESWRTIPRPIDTVVWPLLERDSGVTLRRVLSGGGGWGQKAGLLSLDPDAAYSERLKGHASGADGAKQDTDQPFRDIAFPGDRIQFFISITDPEDVASRAQELDSSSESSGRPSRFEFGTIPSTMDSMPSPPF